MMPFPEHTSRQYFAAYISGLVDGEGSFSLYLARDARRTLPTPSACFAIRLRADDIGVLQILQSFWQCGLIYRGKRGERNPEVHYKIAAIPDLHEIVIPHFDRHPLLAKKARDFALWREGVQMHCAVQARPIRSSGRGTGKRWTDAERKRFSDLIDQIKTGRKYVTDMAEAHKSFHWEGCAANSTAGGESK